eukprot:scaffold2501_cov134-Skeletonema_dohrnii-CCMP3373.AAC.6
MADKSTKYKELEQWQISFHTIVTNYNGPLEKLLIAPLKALDTIWCWSVARAHPNPNPKLNLFTSTTTL